MKYIVTHPGRAHADDFIACCFLVSKYNIPVFRRSPTQEDIADPCVIVVDVGGEYSPTCENYDHHHDSPLVKNKCALELVLSAHFNEYESDINDVFPWLKTVSAMDNYGPASVAKNLGLETPQKLFATQLNPIGPMVLEIFSKQEEIYLFSFEYSLVQKIGDMMTKNLRMFRRRQEHLERYVYPKEIKGLKVLFYYGTENEENPQDGLTEFQRKHHPDAAISVSPNPRGGVSLFRIDNHPRVDFNRVRGDPEVEFAHNNGFLAVVGGGRIDPKTPYWVEVVQSTVEKAIN